MADSFAPKALADITADDVVIITMTNANGTYALANDKGTSAAPTAVAVTVTDSKISTDATNILWKITKDGDNLSITAGESKLYCTNTNNGVRVGTTNGTFIISNDYLCCNSTSSNRFLGVYNSQDWRCYTTINSNITGQTLTFYAKESGETPATKYYMKNNWGAGADWTWKEMTKDGNNYKLENVVFGGTGVNYNTAESDEGASWVAVADIAGDAIAAKDTVTFVLNPTAGTVTATLVGKYVSTEVTKYYMKNNWDAGSDWTWKEMTKDGDNYKLENVVFGGTGVNYNTAADDASATWVPEASILGDAIAAKDTVNLVLNPTAGTVTATIVGKYAESGEPEKTLPVVALAGTMNGWSTTANVLVAAKDSLTASVTVALEAGKDTFKIVSDGKWLSLNGEGETLYGFHREWTTASHINGVDLRNFELTADVAGDYTFTWTYADSTLAITFPEKPAEVDPDQMYIWNGNGVTKADDAIELGGAAEAVQTSGTNIVVGASQKGNWCLKVNKGFSNGEYYVGIAMDNAVNAGDTVKIAYFRASSSASYVLGMDFSADKASAATTYQILSTGDPQYLGSNGVPADSIYIVPEGVANAKYMRIYRNSGSTGLWVSKVEIVKATGTPVPADPTVTVKCSMNEWAEEIPFVLATDKKSASLTANIKKGNYEFKMIINGEWRSNGYTYHRGFTGAAGITGNVDDNMIIQLDVDGDYTFTWTFENDSLGIEFPAKPEPVLANGYYLVGKFGGVDAWSVADLSAAKLFAANLDQEGEYYLENVTLAAEDSLKVVYVEDDAIVTWYPQGEAIPNYGVDANHAGTKTIYFRPGATGGEDWYYGTIYIAPNSATAIINTEAEAKAVKTLKNGILVIEKNGKAYNVLGIQIR